MKRYKLTLRSPSSKIVRPFSDIEDKADKFVLKVQNLLKSGLYDPEFTINLDESGVCTESNRTKTLESKGTTHVVVRSSNKDKENTTVLLGGSMTGEKLMPMIILKGKRNTLDVVIPKNMLVHWREAGSWMDREVFKKYIRLVLKEWSAKIPLDKRGLLLLDNFKGHIDDEIEGLLQDIRIDVQKFPPNTTPYLQPQDISVNGAFKLIYDEFWDEYQFTNNILTPKGNFKAPKKGQKVIWISKAWAKVTLETVQRGYNIYSRKIKVNNQEELEDDEEVQNTDVVCCFIFSKLSFKYKP